MIEIHEHGTLDLQPRYTGDTIRRHILPNTFPMRYTQIMWLEDEEKVSMICPWCKRTFRIKARILASLQKRDSEVPCYPCKMRKAKAA